MNKKEILRELRQRTGSQSVRLPGNIGMEIEKNTLILSLDKGIFHNMQTNDAAFEGWSICLKYWLKELVDTVMIEWDIPLETDEKQQKHYNRFLYRIWKFAATYKWAFHNHREVFENYEEKLSTWVINYPHTDADVHAEHKEAEAERSFVKANTEKYDVISHQLPVGIFDGSIKKENAIMPHKASQIDIWAIKGEMLKIFELKEKTNKEVGIISELMFYVNVLDDVMNHRINYPEEAAHGTYRCFEHLYKVYAERKIREIDGVFLTEELHPLINDGAIQLMNDSERLRTSNIRYYYQAL